MHKNQFGLKYFAGPMYGILILLSDYIQEGFGNIKGF